MRQMESCQGHCSLFHDWSDLHGHRWCRTLQFPCRRRSISHHSFKSILDGSKGSQLLEEVTPLARPPNGVCGCRLFSYWSRLRDYVNILQCRCIIHWNLCYIWTLESDQMLFCIRNVTEVQNTDVLTSNSESMHYAECSLLEGNINIWIINLIIIIQCIILFSNNSTSADCKHTNYDQIYK